MPRTLWVKNLHPNNLAKGTIINSPTRLDKLARRSGWRRRKGRKLTARHFVVGLLAAVTGAERSLRQLASTIGMGLDLKLPGAVGAGRYDTISKQALWERVGPDAVAFLKSVLAELICDRARPGGHELPAIPGIKCVIIEDSTLINLHPALAGEFPAGRNQRADWAGAGLRLQAAFDLVTGEAMRLELTPYLRNDRTAAGDIVAGLGPGYLLLRDLGYYGAPAFTAITAQGAHYLSRLPLNSVLHHGEPGGAGPGERIDLLEHLRDRAPHPGDTTDIDVVIGSGQKGAERLRSRLVGRRVPEAVWKKRLRRLGQEEKRLGKKYSRRHRALLAWEIYITSLPREQVSAAKILEIYPLRWRVEIIFKACKSHSAVREIAAHRSNAEHVQAMLYAWLIALVLAARGGAFALAVEGRDGVLRASGLSLLKVVRKTFELLGDIMRASAAPPSEMLGRLSRQIEYHDRYEKRKKRTDMPTKAAEILGLQLPETAAICQKTSP